MTNKLGPEGHKSIEATGSLTFGDERVAAMVSAYLDGKLQGGELEEFESLLRENKAIAREVDEMRQIENQLREIGAAILSEPIPEALLKSFSRLRQTQESS
jgi:anti-sigma factor RsiW